MHNVHSPLLQGMQDAPAGTTTHTDPLKVDLETCVKLIADSLSNTKGGIIAEYKDSDIQVIDGNYGPYIKHAGSNYKIPKGTDPATLTEDKCKEIISSSAPTGRKKRRR